MEKVTIFANESISVEYLPDKGIIYHVVHKPIAGQPLRDALNAGTEALKQYGITKWLSDDRKNGPLPPEDAEWGFNNWNRRTIEMGWKYWALVVPKEVSAAGSMIPVINSLYDMGLHMMVFTNVEDAFDWLDSRPD